MVGLSKVAIFLFVCALHHYGNSQLSPASRSTNENFLSFPSASSSILAANKLSIRTFNNTLATQSSSLSPSGPGVISFTSRTQVANISGLLTSTSVKSSNTVPPSFPSANSSRLTAEEFSSQDSTKILTLSSSTFGIQSSSRKNGNITTTAKATSTSELSESCLYGKPNCSSTAVTMTADGPLHSAFEGDCMLWNSSCSGNKTEALINFFNVTGPMLLEDDCFMNETSSCSPSILSEVSELKGWMRGPTCTSSEKEWATIASKVQSGFIDIGGTCCNQCWLFAQNVDVYYWPDPDANKSCLSIVGDSVLPLDYGATTDYPGPSTYWGCTSFDHSYGTMSTITTAFINGIGSMKYRQQLADPWYSPQPCPEETLPPPISSASNSKVMSASPSKSIGKRGNFVQARGHSLVAPNVTTISNGSLVTVSLATTVVSNGFTFTSPSIYASFQGIVASDGCGDTMASTAMLTFSPGELSTIIGPRFYADIQIWDQMSSASFDFRDLPCPPQSVMESNYYTPQPGRPYHPFLAIPAQLKKMDPRFSSCTDVFIGAYDPPQTLIPQAVMIPGITSQDPERTAVPDIASPNAVPNAGVAAITTTPNVPLAVGLPKATKDAASGSSIPEEEINEYQTQSSNPPSKSSNDPKQGKGTDAVAGQSPTTTSPNLVLETKTGPGQQAAAIVPANNPGASSNNRYPVPAATSALVKSPVQGGSEEGGKSNSGPGSSPIQPNMPLQTQSKQPNFDPSNISPDQMGQIENALDASPQAGNGGGRTDSSSGIGAGPAANPGSSPVAAPQPELGLSSSASYGAENQVAATGVSGSVAGLGTELSPGIGVLSLPEASNTPAEAMHVNDDSGLATGWGIVGLSSQAGQGVGHSSLITPSAVMEGLIPDSQTAAAQSPSAIVAGQQEVAVPIQVDSSAGTSQGSNAAWSVVQDQGPQNNKPIASKSTEILPTADSGVLNLIPLGEQIPNPQQGGATPVQAGSSTANAQGSSTGWNVVQNQAQENALAGTPASTGTAQITGGGVLNLIPSESQVAPLPQSGTAPLRTLDGWGLVQNSGYSSSIGNPLGTSNLVPTVYPTDNVYNEGTSAMVHNQHANVLLPSSVQATIDGQLTTVLTQVTPDIVINAPEASPTVLLAHPISSAPGMPTAIQVAPSAISSDGLVFVSSGTLMATYTASTELAATRTVVIAHPISILPGIPTAIQVAATAVSSNGLVLISSGSLVATYSTDQVLNPAATVVAYPVSSISGIPTAVQVAATAVPSNGLVVISSGSLVATYTANTETSISISSIIAYPLSAASGIPNEIEVAVSAVPSNGLVVIGSGSLLATYAAITIFSSPLATVIARPLSSAPGIPTAVEVPASALSSNGLVVISSGSILATYSAITGVPIASITSGSFGASTTSGLIPGGSSLIIGSLSSSQGTTSTGAGNGSSIAKNPYEGKAEEQITLQSMLLLAALGAALIAFCI